jgi:hypothetical protein
MWKLYCYFNLDPLTPLYVGVGIKDRPWVHLKFARSDNRAASTHGNPGLIRRLRQLLAMGAEPPIVVLRTGLSYEAALIAERAFIAAIGRVNMGTGPLLNLTSGGPRDDGPSAEELYLQSERELNAQQRRKHELSGLAS